MTSQEVRTELTRALKLDLVGPGFALGDAQEILPQPPSRWYLTGFLVPRDAPPEQAVLADADDEMEAADEEGLDDDVHPERGTGAKKQRLPSSIGLSLLSEAGVRLESVLKRLQIWSAVKVFDPGRLARRWSPLCWQGEPLSCRVLLEAIDDA